VQLMPPFGAGWHSGWMMVTKKSPVAAARMQYLMSLGGALVVVEVEDVLLGVDELPRRISPFCIGAGTIGEQAFF